MAGKAKCRAVPLLDESQVISNRFKKSATRGANVNRALQPNFYVFLNFVEANEVASEQLSAFPNSLPTRIRKLKNFYTINPLIFQDL